MFVIVLKPIWKLDYRPMHMIGWLDLFRLVRIRESETRRSGCLCWIVLDRIWWHQHLVINYFSDLNVWTTLHWFNCWSWATLVWLEFLWFVNGWLGKVPLSLSLSELARWLIWISNLDMAWVWLLNSCPVFCMKDIWDSIKVFILFSKSVNFFSAGGFCNEECGIWLEKCCW